MNLFSDLIQKNRVSVVNQKPRSSSGRMFISKTEPLLLRTQVYDQTAVCRDPCSRYHGLNLLGPWISDRTDNEVCRCFSAQPRLSPVYHLLNPTHSIGNHREISLTGFGQNPVSVGKVKFWFGKAKQMWSAPYTQVSCLCTLCLQTFFGIFVKKKRKCNVVLADVDWNKTGETYRYWRVVCFALRQKAETSWNITVVIMIWSTDFHF